MEDFEVQNMPSYINYMKIKNKIKSLPIRKSPCADQITNLMIKKFLTKQ